MTGVRSYSFRFAEYGPPWRPGDHNTMLIIL